MCSLQSQVVTRVLDVSKDHPVSVQYNLVMVMQMIF